MNSVSKTGPAKIAVRPDSFHRWRSQKDLVTNRVIGQDGLVGR